MNFVVNHCHPSTENLMKVTIHKTAQGLGLSVSGGVAPSPVAPVGAVAPSAHPAAHCSMDANWAIHSPVACSWPGLIRIKKIFVHGAAWQTGRLAVGDVLLAVNGQPLTGSTNYVSHQSPPFFSFFFFLFLFFPPSTYSFLSVSSITNTNCISLMTFERIQKFKHSKSFNSKKFKKNSKIQKKIQKKFKNSKIKVKICVLQWKFVSAVEKVDTDLFLCVKNRRWWFCCFWDTFSCPFIWPAECTRCPSICANASEANESAFTSPSSPSFSTSSPRFP